MEDMLFFSVLAYLLVFSFISGLMPDDLFTGNRVTAPDNDDLRTDLENIDPADAGSVYEHVGFFTKVMTFAFVPIAISGIPTVIGLILQIINTGVLVISIVWVVDKARKNPSS